jgi:DsbC/DsbD-like thiol-disulfide interchange protein
VISARRRGAYVGVVPRNVAIAAALAALLLPAAASAQAAGGLSEPPAELSVLPGWRTDHGTHMAALRIVLKPGWKTYWRSPGDAGIPPQFRWDGSENLASVRFHWPRPGVYEIGGMRSIGYYRELVLPIELTPRRPGEPIRVRADVEIGVCRDVCVPMFAEIAAELSATSEGSVRDPRIDAALANRPATAREAGVRDVDCDVEPTDDGLRLTARIDMPRLGPEEVAVFELPDPAIWISESSGGREGPSLLAASEMVPPSGRPFLLDRSAVRITVISPDRAVELQGCPAG